MKSKVIITTLNELGEEVEDVIKECNTIKEAENFVLEHEQEFADNPNIYSIYIQ